jgi:hypothetical protein
MRPEDTLPEAKRIRIATRMKLSVSVGIAFLIAAVAVRLGWEYVDPFSIERFATITTSILCVLGIGALIILIILNPQRLKSPPFFITVAGVVLLGLIGGLLHYLRFVFISDVPPLAIVIATSLLLATSCGFVSILYAIRWLRLTERDGPISGSRNEEV